MDLFKLFGTIAINNKEANKALSETSGEGEKAESKLGKAFGAIGKGAAVVGKTVAAGMAAGAAAVGALVTKSVQAYADYEQLVGGVDTLFKESSAKVQEYAANAYKTAGLSANQYMETVTSFSASLLQSLDGDTAKAAEAANMAITDMSDNANKMGTSMEMIQNAYNGFAKQNYTMLDNLKLGYGGTKEEMQRLLEDAEKLSGQKFDLSSYADVVDAIHVIQTEMGITGTTAKEASSTISGSLASMKGAWQNVLTAISSDELPFDTYVKNFVDSVTTVGKNLLPRIEIALGGVVQLIQGLAPVIIGAIPGLLNSILPAVTNAATSLLQALLSALPGAISAISAALPGLLSAFSQIFGQILQMIPVVFDQILSLLPTLAPLLIDGVSQAFLQLIGILPSLLQSVFAYLPEFCQKLADSLKSNLPVLIQGIVSVLMEIVSFLPQAAQILGEVIPFLVESLCSILVENLPILIQGILALCQAIFSAADQIIEAILPMVPLILEMVVSALQESLPILVEGCILLLQMVAENAPLIINSLLAELPSILGLILSAIWQLLPVILGSIDALLGACWDFIWQFLGNLLAPIGQFFSDMWNSAVTALQSAWNWCVDLLSKVGSWIYNTVIAPVVKFFSDLWRDIVSAYHTVIDPWIEIIKRISKIIYDSVIAPVLNYFKNLWSDIKGIFSVVKGWFNQNVVQPVTGFFKNMWSGLKNGASDAWSGIKNTFGKVKSWFQEKFTEAWTAVKNVFSTGGKIFDGIKEGISSVFTTTVNKIIRGINKVVKVPFEGLNKILGKIAGIEILGVKPFSWLTWRASIPVIPELAKGGVLEKGQVGLLEGNGAEAVVPLDQNRAWISKVAQDMNVAVGGNNEGIISSLEEIRDLLVQFFPDVMNALLSLGYAPDEATLARWLAPALNKEFGRLAIQGERGR